MFLKQGWQAPDIGGAMQTTLRDKPIDRPDTDQAGHSVPSSWSTWWRRNAISLVVTVAVVISGMMFALFWLPVTRHAPQWFIPGDAWGVFRAAHFVAWGDLSGVYDRGNGVVAFPGLAILLAPLAALGDSFHLTESVPPFVLSRPTAFLLLGPAELLVSSVAIFASNSLVERLGAPRGRRIGVCVAVGVLAWSSSAFWGHGEDALVAGLALFALLAVLDKKWTRAGWIFGGAVAIQPLVLLALPVLIAGTPVGRRLAFTFRSLVLSAYLVVVALLGDAANTIHALVSQPTPPALNHATPWASISPQFTERIGQLTLPPNWSRIPSGPRVLDHSTTMIFVSGGMARACYLGMAALLGIWVLRHPQPPLRLLWLVGVVLAARCGFEAVMTPYYLVPPFIVLLVVASVGPLWRFLAVVGVALGTAAFAYLHLPPWEWWLPVVLGTALLCILARPIEDGEHVEALTTAPHDVESN